MTTTTTTNYGWTIPQDSELVKDGAAAIRTLGNAADASLKTVSDAAIAKTIVDAKGDIIAATAADTVSRVAVGTDGQVLTADAASAAGVKWALPASGGMTLLSTTTLSGTSTTINSISSSYNSLIIYITGVTYGSGGYPKIAPNGSTTISEWSGVDGGGNNWGFADYIKLSAYNWSTTDTNNSCYLEIDNYSSSTTVKSFSTYGIYKEGGPNAMRSFSYGGGINTTSAISSLVFSATGASFSGGTVKIYGVK